MLLSLGIERARATGNYRFQGLKQRQQKVSFSHGKDLILVECENDSPFYVEEQCALNKARSSNIPTLCLLLPFKQIEHGQFIDYLTYKGIENELFGHLDLHGALRSCSSPVAHR